METNENNKEEVLRCQCGKAMLQCTVSEMIIYFCEDWTVRELEKEFNGHFLFFRFLLPVPGFMLLDKNESKKLRQSMLVKATNALNKYHKEVKDKLEPISIIDPTIH